MVEKFVYLPGLPVLIEPVSAVFSFMFYDLERPLSDLWIDIIEDYFSFHGHSPEHIVMHHQEDMRGHYKSYKSKLQKGLQAAQTRKPIDFHIRSKTVTDGEGFFPSDVSVSINSSGPGSAQGVFSVRQRPGNQCDADPTKLAKRILSLGGAFYGHASVFPAILGPELYAACVGAIPKGWSFSSTRAYTKRLTAWREHGARIDSLNGFFREVYPYNFLNRKHFANPIMGLSARRFFEQFGQLEALDVSGAEFLWKISDEAIPEARKALEAENLVLSAR